MYAKIVGIRKMEFTGLGGNKVDGAKIHFIYKENGTEGEKAENAFIASEKMKSWEYQPYIGQEISIEYNRYGKIQEVREV